MNKKKPLKLDELDVYQLARKLSSLSWKIYSELNWQDKKNFGDQFLASTDSVGANIAEGYRRYHYLDKIKFLYNSRASLSECGEHWLELLKERNKIKIEDFNEYKGIFEKLNLKINNFINSLYKLRERKIGFNKISEEESLYC